MTFGSALASAAFLVVNAVAVLAVAVRIARRTAPRDRLAAMVIGLLIGLLQIVLVLQVTAMIGVLGRPAVLVMHVAVAAVVLTIVKAAPTEPARPGRPSSLAMIAVAVPLAFLCLAVVLSLRGPSQEVDTAHYHVPNASFFMREHSLWKLPPATPGYWTNTYPSDGELVGVWLMLPTHDDRIAYLQPLAFAILCVAGAALLSRELTPGRAWAGGLAATAVIVTPLGFHTQVHSLLVDFAATGSFVTGAALAVRARRLGGDAVAIALSAAAFGLAIGSKYPVLLPGLFGLLALVVLMPRGRRLTSIWIAGVAAAIPSAVWFVRTGLATGNPVFPKGVTLGGHEILTAGRSPLEPLQTTVLQHLLDANSHALRVWVEQLWRSYGLALGLIGIGWLAVAYIAITKRERVALVMGLLAAASFVAYMATPYTGGGPQAVVFLVSSQIRYSLPATVLAAAAGSAFIPPILFAVLAAPALAQDAVRALQGPTYRPDVTPGRRQVAEAAVLFAAVAAVAYWVAARRLPTVDGRARAALVAVGTAVAVAIVAVALREMPGPGPADPATLALQREHRPDGPMLLVGVANVRPFLGPTLRNHYVTVKDGGAAGEVPITDVARFDAAVRRIDPAVIVVGTLQQTAPPNWQPGPGWTQVGAVEGSRVFAPAGSS